MYRENYHYTEANKETEMANSIQSSFTL